MIDFCLQYMDKSFVNSFLDDRGELIAFNDIDLMKRCYVVTNFGNDTVRAFHKNTGETKYFSVLRGTVLFVTFRDRKNPVKTILSKGQTLVVSENTWNGWKALEGDSMLIAFSDAKMEERSDERIDAHCLCKHPKCVWVAEDR